MEMILQVLLLVLGFLMLVKVLNGLWMERRELQSDSEFPSW